MKKMFYAAMATVAIAAVAPAAQAAEVTPMITFADDGSGRFAGTFERAGIPQGNFQDFVRFATTVDGFLASTVTSIAVQLNSPNDLDLLSVFLNAPNGRFEFTRVLGSPGEVEFRLLNDTFITAGNQNIEINGLSRGNGAFAGTLAFQPGAIPEPSTWGMMLIGFGAVGYSLRRRSGYRIAQAV